jgi:hypothetical protein
VLQQHLEFVMTNNGSKRALRMAIVGGLVLAISACATSRQQSQGSSSGTSAAMASSDSMVAAGKKKVICTMERSVGSNIPQRVCWTPESREAEREETQRLLYRAQPSPTPF